MIVAGMAEPIPPEVGQLQIFVSDWDWTDAENIIERYEPLPTHTCTEEELGIAAGS